MTVKPHTEFVGRIEIPIAIRKKPSRATRSLASKKRPIEGFGTSACPDSFS